MEGVRVYPVCRYPNGVSEFAAFFADVLADLDHLVWVSGEDTPFRFPAAERLLDELEPLPVPAPPGCEPAPCWLLPPGFLRRHAAEVSDDWNEFLGLARAPRDWAAWLAERFFYDDNRRAAQAVMERRARHLEATVEACFFSVDGAYWEFFARDPALLDRVATRCSALPGVRVERVPALSDSVGL